MDMNLEHLNKMLNAKIARSSKNVKGSVVTYSTAKFIIHILTTEIAASHSDASDMLWSLVYDAFTHFHHLLHGTDQAPSDGHERDILFTWIRNSYIM